MHLTSAHSRVTPWIYSCSVSLVYFHLSQVYSWGSFCCCAYPLGSNGVLTHFPATVENSLHFWVCPQGQMKEKSWWAGCRWKTSETVRWEWKLRMRLRGVERSDERKGHVRGKKWNPDDQMQQEAVIFLWSVQHTEHGNIWRNCISTSWI